MQTKNQKQARIVHSKYQRRRRERTYNNNTRRAARQHKRDTCISAKNTADDCNHRAACTTESKKPGHSRGPQKKAGATNTDSRSKERQRISAAHAQFSTKTYCKEPESEPNCDKSPR